MSEHPEFEQRISQLEATVRDLETCNRGNVTALLRMQAQTSAVYSLLAEVTQEQGVALEVVRSHLRTRTNYFLDRMLVDAEMANPHLGAVLDDRMPEEVPAGEGFSPLFPREL